MISFFKKFVDLILYSNLWIALCAAAMALQTQYIWFKTIKLSPFIALVFFSTLFLYAIHRIVGLSKVKDFLAMERYAVISTFKSHIIFYAVIAGMGALYFFWKIPLLLKVLLFVPTLISLGYVLPIFGQQRRLRDFNQIKIYLIALVWAWVTVILVVQELIFPIFFWHISSSVALALFLLFIERTCFIFAITLPFDIRDLKVDAKNEVSTIPAKIGANQSKYLAYTLILVASLSACFLWYMELYTLGVLAGILLSYVLTSFLISYTDTVAHDYFFTGLMDGTMLLQFGLVYLFQIFMI